MAEQLEWTIDVSAATFEREVLERSREVPVIVDFWATWCGPCRQLAPLLEKLVEERQGQIVLAKVNIDEDSDLAGLFGVQSIPYVVAFRDGHPIEQFRGLLPEEQLREWIDRLVPSAAELLAREGESLEQDSPA